MKTIDSKITSVTVYTDRAQITRTGTIKLDIGEQRVCFDNLPEAIEQKSIRVAGEGDVILQDIKFKSINFSTDQNQSVKDLNDKLRTLDELYKKQETIINLADKEYSFLEKITEKITSPTKVNETGELNPESWIQMISFYRKKLEELEQQKNSAKKEIDNINNRINKTNNDMYQLNTGTDKVRNQVEIAIEMQSAGEIILELTYMVYGPCWYPVYDMRVSTDTKMLNLTYNAMILQSTTEDWKDIKLKLSTAKPHIDGTTPELVPWHVNEYITPVMISEPFESEMPMARSEENSFKKSRMSKEFGASKKQAPLIPSTEYSVESQATSVLFTPSGKNTILSDNTPYKVTILIKDFPAKFKYNAIPKLSAYTYLESKIKNSSEYPLIAGECNIFMDNNFVSNSSIKNVAPEEEFWISLGIDETMQVERKFIRRYEKKEGLITKKTKYIYEYVFVIENKRKTEEKLTLKDQIPITGHQDITIELITPIYNEKDKNLNKDNQNILEWDLTPVAGEKKEIQFIFSVEYPKNMDLSGLE